MEAILRKTIKSGNASAVVLPKAWLNKNVKVELLDKTPEIILCEVLEIVNPYLELSEVIGIYIVGSYARNDQTSTSDIDILIISEKTSHEVIKKGSYEIMIVSLGLLNYKLEENLLPIGTMLKEAVPILNKSLLKQISIKVTKKNIKWYLETTKNRMAVIKRSISMIERKKPDGKLSDSVVYSLILRLRTLYMIDCLKNNKKYEKSNFLKLVKDISGSLTAYDRYVRIKNNGEGGRETPLAEGKNLYEYLERYLQKVSYSIK